MPSSGDHRDIYASTSEGLGAQALRIRSRGHTRRAAWASTTDPTRLGLADGGDRAWHGESRGWKLDDPWAYRYFEL
ncbi:MAG: hypothetical protein ACHP7F_12220, partial [Actinomycetales bacterium]